MSRKVVKTITQKQRFDLSSRLKECLIARDDGLWEYKVGFDDDYIAVEFGIPKSTVKNARTNVFGKLYIRGPSKAKPINLIGDHPDIAEMKADIEKLQRESRAIRRWIKDNFDVVLSMSEPMPLKPRDLAAEIGRMINED